MTNKEKFLAGHKFVFVYQYEFFQYEATSINTQEPGILTKMEKHYCNVSEIGKKHFSTYGIFCDRIVRSRVKFDDLKFLRHDK